jgi:signal transduction histidine kinase
VTAPDPPEPGSSVPAAVRRHSLRRRVATASLAILVLLAALFTTIIASVLNFKHRGDEAISRWQPAFSLSQQALADLVNQETGVRGYALSGDPRLLQPYTDFRPEERRNEASLQRLLEGHSGLLQEFAVFRTAAESWRAGVAGPAIAAARAGDPGVAASVGTATAKQAFDTVRTKSAALTRAIAAQRDDALAARRSAVRLVWIAVGISAGLIVLSGLMLWRGLRATVLMPVEELATQTRAVAEGSIDQRIHASGPPELAGLGRDVDSMRARIASELARVEQARSSLAERSEELARSNADLEQFAYVASHDLSEPLRKVANFCQLLERQYGDQLDDKAKQYIAFAVDGAKRMQNLIADLLSFSRVGRTTEAFETVDLDHTLSRALAVLEDRVAATDAEVVRAPLPRVDGDPTLLVALFQNLVGNALKYASPERRPRIEISVEPHEPGWLFTVADNGIGIDPKYAERIFTIFQRLHLRDQYGGTGIGLALCRKIVEFHRGRIWLADADGPGARFQFTLPEHAGRTEVRDEVSAGEH